VVLFFIGFVLGAGGVGDQPLEELPSIKLLQLFSPVIFCLYLLFWPLISNIPTMADILPSGLLGFFLYLLDVTGLYIISCTISGVWSRYKAKKIKIS
jgi:hypothetical protein